MRIMNGTLVLRTTARFEIISARFRTISFSGIAGFPDKPCFSQGRFFAHLHQREEHGGEYRSVCLGRRSPFQLRTFGLTDADGTEVLGPDRIEYDWNANPLGKKKWWGK